MQSRGTGLQPWAFLASAKNPGLKPTSVSRRVPRAEARCYSGKATTAALTITMCMAFTGCHSTPPPVPLDQLNAQQQRGHGVFLANCSLCHYDRVDDKLHGPSLRGLYKKPYLPSGAPANDDRVRATVLHGRGMMPAQPQLSPDAAPGDLDDLIAYLHTL